MSEMGKMRRILTWKIPMCVIIHMRNDDAAKTLMKCQADVEFPSDFRMSEAWSQNAHTMQNVQFACVKLILSLYKYMLYTHIFDVRTKWRISVV